MEFVAFDFETANYQRYSACSLGAVKVVDGIMVEHFYTLIDPQTSFAASNIAIHGITADQVKGQPDYRETILAFRDFVGEAPVVSHTQFDRAVIQSANERYGLDSLALDYFDSCQLARRIWRGKTQRFGLKPLCDLINFQFNHHNALEDARAAAYIVQALGLYTKSQSIEELLKSANINAFYTI
ncbi:3'-5' exonuclease [Aerococcaceae bacterium WGS1372]